MKTEGAIRQKLKQVRFRHAKRSLDSQLSRAPHNCKHNTLCEVPGLGAVAVCGLTPSKLCDAERGADNSADCSAYTPLYTKDDVKLALEQEFQASIPEVAVKYPDAAALMWVLADDNNEAVSLMDPFGESGVFVGTFFGASLWTNTEGSRDMVALALNTLVQSEAQFRRELQAKTHEFEGTESELLDLRARHTRAEQDLSSIEADLNEVTSRVRQLEVALQAVTEERDALRAKFDLPLWSPDRWTK